MRNVKVWSWPRAALLVLAIAPAARADTPSCRVLQANLVPSDGLQIVAWVETAPPESKYVDTIFLTQKVGRYGLGNRPGQYDLNSGPVVNDMWPYGRRITTFPVWAHRHGVSFPLIVFQNGQDDDISHPVSDSSTEHLPYCRPMLDNGSDKPFWDAGTCATTSANTDKGTFDLTGKTSQYPPRTDLTRQGVDSPSVDMYKALNPWDAVTQATPLGGMPAQITWAVPSGLAAGNYVLQVEVSKAFDFNATYNSTVFPSPANLPYGNYGEPYRGQPSVVYSVPFTVGPSSGHTATSAYAGYGDPTGATGTLHAPDATITTDTPGSGAGRLELIPGSSDVIQADFRIEADNVPPAQASSLQTPDIEAGSVTLSFVSPGDDGQIGKVAGYEIRYRSSDPMTASNFDDAKSVPIMASVPPVDPGAVQSVSIQGLLPETTYWIGVRAYDECHNVGDVSVVQVTTTARVGGYVDACFVATAAFGSKMATDVETLRRFRDVLLRRSVLGELAIETYYTFSPPVAGMVGQSEILRQAARDFLAPIILAVGRAAF